MRKLLNFNISLGFGLILALFVSNSVWAQQKYYVYQYNKTYGLTDLSGSDLIEGDFTDVEDDFTDSNFVVFENKAEKYVLINLKTGKQELFDTFKPFSFYAEDEYFSFVEKNGKYYYRGRETEKIIPVPKELSNNYFSQIGMINKNYLLAISTEEVKEPVKKSKTPVKKGVIPPPTLAPSYKEKTYVYLFKNQKSLPFIKKIEIDSDRRFSSSEANSLFTFFEVRKTPKTDKKGEVSYVTFQDRTYNPDLKPWHFAYESPFDIATLTVGKKLIICDSTFKVLKTVPKSEDNDASDLVKTYLTAAYPNDDINVSFGDFSPPVSMGGLGGTRKSFWDVKEKDGFSEISYLKDEQYVPYLKAKGKAEIHSNNIIELTDEKENSLYIYLDRAHLNVLPIPQKHSTAFQITKL